MTSGDDGTIAPTPEQDEIIVQPVDALLVITAGPGTGKTTTLVHRIAHLVELEQTAAPDLLVLTFSRAAVATLRERLRQLGEGAARVRARTFDSWALELLSVCGRVEETFDGNFDARIRRAGEALSEGVCDGLLNDLAHVVVDEVQDLVGVRRHLVETLLESFECGFTVVGDLAQSVYGFTAGGARGETGAFVRNLRTTFGAKLVERSLTTNFRARNAEVRTALAWGDALRAAALGDRRELLDDLRDELASLQPLGAINDPLTLGALSDQRGTTAVLCRTNGEALLVSGALAGASVPHRLRRDLTDRAVPGWISSLFRLDRGSTLTRTDLDAIAEETCIDGTVDDVWRLLLRTARGSGGRVVDLARLRQAVADGRLPDELVAEHEPSLLVSSIHRAKGLEFDRVVIADPGRWTPDDCDEDEEARLLFVALTRARDEMWLLRSVRDRSVQKVDRSYRWARYGPQGRRSYQRFGLEARGGDVAPDVSLEGFDPGAEARQDGAVGRLRPGDVVELRRLDVVVPDGEAPEYLVVRGEGSLGRASAAFRRDLVRFLPPRTRRFPRAINDLRVDSVETVATGLAATLEAGLNEHGIRRVPRLTGLSRFDWKEIDD